MNEVMPILADMRSHGRGRTGFDLDPEPVSENWLARGSFSLNIFMGGQQEGREVVEHG